MEYPPPPRSRGFPLPFTPPLPPQSQEREKPCGPTAPGYAGLPAPASTAKHRIYSGRATPAPVPAPTEPESHG